MLLSACFIDQVGAQAQQAALSALDVAAQRHVRARVPTIPDVGTSAVVPFRPPYAPTQHFGKREFDQLVREHYVHSNMALQKSRQAAIRKHFNVLANDRSGDENIAVRDRAKYLNYLAEREHSLINRANVHGTSSLTAAREQQMARIEGDNPDDVSLVQSALRMGLRGSAQTAREGSERGQPRSRTGEAVGTALLDMVNSAVGALAGARVSNNPAVQGAAGSLVTTALNRGENYVYNLVTNPDGETTLESMDTDDI